MQTITIINTGCANLSSVKFAFERLGYQAEITDDLAKIQSAKTYFTGSGNGVSSNAKYAISTLN